MRILKLLGSMDIPQMRRDINTWENVRWMLRNLPINNADNPNLKEVMRLLDELEKEFHREFIARRNKI